MNVIMDSKSPRKPRSNTRPLGAVRKNGSATKLPPLYHSANHIDGITGAAMNVPPPRLVVPNPTVTTERVSPHIDKSALTERPSPEDKTKKSDTSENSKSPQNDRENSAKLKAIIEDLKQQLAKTKEAAVIKEKDLKLEILQLQKLVDELKMQIWDKEKIIEQLKEQFMRQEEHYRELYEKECAAHKETRDELTAKVSEMEKIRNEHAKIEEELRRNCEETKAKMQTDLDNLKQKMTSEVAARDEKLAKIKRQMAETLQGNSWERQQQLDELSKELNKAHEEIDVLKMKVRSSNKHSLK